MIEKFRKGNEFYSDLDETQAESEMRSSLQIIYEAQKREDILATA